MSCFLHLCDLFGPVNGPGTSPAAAIGVRDLTYFIHLAGVHSALYTLQVAEIQLRDLALDYLLRLASRLSELHQSATESDSDIRKKEVKTLIKQLIIGPLWQGKWMMLVVVHWLNA